jgi:hypothetical protein
MTVSAAVKNHRQKVGVELRNQVFRTYGDTCHLCGERVNIGQRSADHVKSVRAGGSTVLGNLRPAHKFCNQLRGARLLTAELKAEIRARYVEAVVR